MHYANRFGGGCSLVSLLTRVVTTIALKEDAPIQLVWIGGDDAPWRRMLQPACWLVVTTIAWRTMLQGSLLPWW